MSANYFFSVQQTVFSNLYILPDELPEFQRIMALKVCLLGIEYRTGSFIPNPTILLEYIGCDLGMSLLF